MDNTLTKITDKFTHFLRDLLFYGLSGSVVLLFFLFIKFGDRFFHNIACDFSNGALLVSIVISYVIGHILMGIGMFLLKIMLCLEIYTRKIMNWLCKQKTSIRLINSLQINRKLANFLSLYPYNNLKLEIDVFNRLKQNGENFELFSNYIERYNTLFHLRLSLSMAFLVNGIIFCIYKGKNTEMFYYYVSIMTAFGILLYSTVLTLKGFKRRLKIIDKIKKNKDGE